MTIRQQTFPRVYCMASGESEIPSFWVLIPFLVITITVTTWRLVRGGALTAPRFVTGVAVCVYAAAVLNAVLLPYPIRPRNGETDLPWQTWINLVPLADNDPAGLLLNLALFVPLGAVLPLMVPSISVIRVMSIGFLASLSIECIQLVGDLTISPGRVFDVDDLIANTGGAVVGYGLAKLTAKLPGVRRIIARFEWPSANRSHRKKARANNGADDGNRTRAISLGS